jgi:HAD superfamily hydrolase (TIGR01490 family)
METTSLKDRNTTKNYIVFFDLDRTIEKSVSGIALARGAFRKGLLTRWNFVDAIFLSVVFRLKLTDPLKIMNNLIGWVKGIPEKSLSDLCTEIFHEVLLPSVYNEAVAEIEFHKTRNAHIVILSSALKTVCHEMAMFLNIDDIICSELEVENGYLTGRPLGRLCFGEEKALRLQEYCNKNNYRTSDAWYYGDSISDLQVLNTVGIPVCVNPDKKLRKTAQKRGWKILSWDN